MVIVAVLGATSRLTLPDSPLSLVLLLGPLYCALYVVKFRILFLDVQPWLALLLYFLSFAALLPYLYACVFSPWEHTDADPLVDWVGGPIATFTVPTAFFLYDVLARRRRGAAYYAVRTLLEVCVLVPISVIAVGSIAFYLGLVAV